MGDYQDFCEAYGGCASDPDFMDNWLDKYARPDNYKVKRVAKNKELTIDSTSTNNIPKGKLVHMVKLTGSRPAKAIKVIWDIILKENINCSKANYLGGLDYDDPARWFVANGFTVRSMKERGHWFQLIFKASNTETKLTDAQKSEYESIAFPKS